MYLRSNRLVAAVLGLIMVAAALVFVTQQHQAASAVQPTFPIRAAFYYPWFPETWGSGTNYHPTLGQYDSSNSAVIKQHIAWMQSAGIQAGIASWWGQGTLTDGRFPALESNVGATGFKWTAYYEQEGNGNPTQSQIASDLTYLKSHYVTNHPQWLRVNKKPVLFVYGDASDDCSTVSKWLAANNNRFYLNMKVFSGYRNCASQPNSWHQYAPSARTDAQLPYSYSISPGFWKAGETSPRLARDPASFTSAAQSMVASGAQWQLITTFNEWGEGTAIEPATEWGQTYLDALSGSSPSPTTSSTSPPPSGAVDIIFMENHERSGIVGNTSAPYLNGLLPQGINFTNYYGVTHPSLPNYLAFASGSTDGKVGTDSITAGEISGATVWKQLSNAGVSWTVNEESMPSACYGGTSSGNYQLKHDPAIPFAEIFNDKTLCAHVVPYTGGVPTGKVNFITPNMCNDMHDCSVATGDSWLQARVPAMLAAGQTVVITFDEGSSGTNGGGNIYTVVVGNGVTPRVITTTYNHYSLLAGIEAKYGLARLGAAASAAPLPLS
jgi:hypothetical protein